MGIEYLKMYGTYVDNLIIILNLSILAVLLITLLPVHNSIRN